MRHLVICSLQLVSALLFTQPLLAQPLTVPIKLDYPVIQQILGARLFTGADQRANLFGDEWDCNTLNLKNPVVSGTTSGQILIQSDLDARGGTPIGNRCIPLFSWSGVLNTQLAPTISPDGSRLQFHVIDSRLSKMHDSQTTVPAVVWNWVKAYAHPELERFEIDLKPVLDATRSLLETAIPAEHESILSALNSVAFSHITSNTGSLRVDLQVVLPDTQPITAKLNTGVLTRGELARWDAAWQSWDTFITWLIKDLAAQSGRQRPEMTQALATTLLEARYDLRLALTEQDLERDPVRDLFVKTWAHLAPLVQQELQNAPEMEVLKYLSFISAVDALIAIDSVADHFSLRFDAATLRGLARLLRPTVADDEFLYNTNIDPALRALLGLDPDFDKEPGGLQSLSKLPFSLMVSTAYASAVDPALVNKLTGWVPSSSDVENYLATVNLLLNSILDSERRRGKVPPQFLEIYENLVLTTAWQESCWRQFERRNGQITPLKSPAGSVGLMQVNQHVWRGVYDPSKLYGDIAYNARAGNEILVHYLVDYAIKKREQDIAGGAHNLARAAYAVYNGGPRHLDRYRNASTGKALREIDNAFWKKYQSIQVKGADAVKACYGR